MESIVTESIRSEEHDDSAIHQAIAEYYRQVELGHKVDPSQFIALYPTMPVGASVILFGCSRFWMGTPPFGLEQPTDGSVRSG